MQEDWQASDPIGNGTDKEVKTAPLFQHCVAHDLVYPFDPNDVPDKRLPILISHHNTPLRDHRILVKQDNYPGRVGQIRPVKVCAYLWRQARAGCE